MTKFYRKIPIVKYSEFLTKVNEVEKFTSSTGKRYSVTGIDGDVLYFERQDAGNSSWDIDIKKLYEAYIQLENFKTKNFRLFVPRRHSPGRGLLLHLGLIHAQ